MDDRELLRDYVGRRSQDAFGQLVERHLSMVYSAARRIVHDPHLAEEVAQSVFTTLARKAKTIQPPQIVGGWLYNTTRHLSFNVVRGEQRRREREQTAIAMQTLELAPNDPRVAENLEPLMAELDNADRDALVLRYLEDRTLREVGTELGISEDAARMRVNRALERLRAGFSRAGVTVSAVILAAAMTSSASAVPPGLATAIVTSTLAGARTVAVIGVKIVAATVAVAGIVLAIVSFSRRLGEKPNAGRGVNAVRSSAVRPRSEVPAGSIKFVDYDVQRFLPLYASIAGVQLDVHARPEELTAKISFQNTQDLSRAEAVALLEQTLREQAGLVVLRDSLAKGRVTVVTLEEAKTNQRDQTK